MKVKVILPNAGNLIQRKGLDKNGWVQKQFTNMVSGRIVRYMPASSATRVLATKLKFIKSPTEIEVLGPYAKYQYFGKAMVNAKTGKGPALIPGVGYRYRKGTILKVTNRDLDYSDSYNKDAGPFWDRALMAAEGKAIVNDMQELVDRGRGNVSNR